jgi:PadR family transcriptional regulator PadR
MRILSRTEELVLLSIWKLGEYAYCVPLLQEAQKYTGKKWTLSGIYIPLGRLEKKGFVKSYFGEPTSQRGGKRKRFYRITRAGFRALKEIRDIEKSMWEGLSETALKKHL